MRSLQCMTVVAHAILFRCAGCDFSRDSGFRDSKPLYVIVSSFRVRGARFFFVFFHWLRLLRLPIAHSKKAKKDEDTLRVLFAYCRSTRCTSQNANRILNRFAHKRYARPSQS